MGWNNGIMTVPISMGDISQAVGYSSLDLGTLIANGIIKKWALHKPVMLITGYDTPIDIYPNDATWLNYMQNYVREINSNTLCPFGLKVTPSNDLYKIVGLTTDSSVDWVYQQPPATGTFWRRMLDFKGYTNTPNVPMNTMTDFSFYKDSTNTIVIDTNDGEAGSTSIQVSQLSTLNDYNLMLAVNGGSGYWYLVIMDTTIMNSVNSGTISFTLPTSGLPLGSGTYNAYVVGVSKSTTMSKNTWVSQSNSAVQNFSWNMIPLPFESKSNSHFSFKVVDTAPTNIIYISYTFYIKNSTNIIQKIVFDAEKYQSTSDLNQLSVSLTNLVVHDDNETGSWNINNSVTINGFVYNSTTRKITASKELDVAIYGINAGDYPYLTYNHSVNKSGLTTADTGTQGVIWVD